MSYMGVAIVAGSAIPAWADVSDGNMLPQGAQQFSRLIRVRSDLKVGNLWLHGSDRRWNRCQQL